MKIGCTGELTKLVKVRVQVHRIAGRGPGDGRGTGRGQIWAPDLKACRYAFLLDKALLICKRRGDSYDLKASVNLHSFQVRDDSSGDRDNKKVRLCHQDSEGGGDSGALAAWPWGCPYVEAKQREKE